MSISDFHFLLILISLAHSLIEQRLQISSEGAENIWTGYVLGLFSSPPQAQFLMLSPLLTSL
jgi:hypothetical protein